jgi:hypothetical protein
MAGRSVGYTEWERGKDVYWEGGRLWSYLRRKVGGSGEYSQGFKRRGGDIARKFKNPFKKGIRV